MTIATAILPTQLPSTIHAYLAAHAAGEADAAVRAFAPTAEVVDEGKTFRGTEEVLGFLRHGGGDFTYTTELVGAERLDESPSGAADAHWVALVRLAGDFPGGVAELHYHVTLVDDLITRLVIAP